MKYKYRLAKTALLNLFILSFSAASLGQCFNGTPSGMGAGMTNVSIGILNNTTPGGEGYTVEYDSVGVLIPNIPRCEGDSLIITGPGTFFQSIEVWIDWDQNNVFNDEEEYYVSTLVWPPVAITKFFINPPGDAMLGNTVMRIAGSSAINPLLDPCKTGTGDVEDYLINVSESNMSIDSVIVEQATTCYRAGDTTKPVLRIGVFTKGTQNPITVNSFTLNINGTTLNTDIADVKMFYTGNESPTFPGGNEFGSNLGSSPSTVNYNFNGNQTLVSNDCDQAHYFWLTYDISNNATSGNSIDAECSNIDVAIQGTPTVIIPNIIAPTGNGIISNVVEICDNGIDDDCDGLIDCFDPDCFGTGNCQSSSNTFFYGGDETECKTNTDDTTLQLVIEWENFTCNDKKTPIIGDIDGDGIPELLHTDNADMIIFNGSNGTIKSKITGAGAGNRSTVIADIDNDGTAEIFILDLSYLYRFEHDATNISGYTWRVAVGGSTVVLAIADFNNDGNSEIYSDLGLMWNANTGKRLGIAPGRAFPGPIAADFFPSEYCATCSGLELLTSTKIYSVDIIADSAYFNVLATFPKKTVTSMMTGYVDADGDGLLDVIGQPNYKGSSLYIWDPRKNTILGTWDPALATPSVTAAPGFFGYSTYTPPAAADIDNDGLIEYVVAVSSNGGSGARGMFAIDDIQHGMAQLWYTPGPYEETGGLSPVIFDFEGDGIREIAFLGEYHSGNPILGTKRFFMINAQNGDIRAQFDATNTSGGTQKGTQVVDIDGDGQVEIVVGGQIGPAGFIVLGNATNNWVCGRQIWNQISYNPMAINDNLTVPQFQQNQASFPDLNGYNIQASFKDFEGNYACNKMDAQFIQSINTADSLCLGDTLQLSANTSQGQVFLWEPPTYLSNDSILNPLANPDSSITYTLFVTDTMLNCTDDTSISIKIFPKPTIDLGENTTTCEGNSILIADNSLNNASGGFLWSDNSTGQNFLASEAGVYWLTYSNNGCTITDSIEILFSQCEVFAPNAFSPNGDGFNDFFTIKGGDEINNILIKIYNRWGDIVFQSTDITIAWNGYKENKPQPEAVYIYQAVGEFIDGTKINLNGNITLVR